MDRAERRVRVLDYFAENPNATYRAASASLGIPKSTIADDLTAALAEITERSRDAMIAAMINRNQRIVGACMPLVLRRGSTQHGTLALAADKRTAELLGLDAPKKREITGKDGAPIRHEHDHRRHDFSALTLEEQFALDQMLARVESGDAAEISG